MNKRKAAIASMGLLTGALLLSGCLSEQGKGTYDLYLIPEGYEGNIRVTYNVNGAPGLAKEGKFDVIPVDGKGTAETSNPMFDYGEVIDRYYYVDERGNRAEIPPECVHVKGTGGSSDARRELHYTDIEITRSSCGDEFRAWGSQPDRKSDR